MKPIFSELEKLYQRAGALLKTDSTAEQVIVALTGDGVFHCTANHDVTAGDTRDEDAFVRALAESGHTHLLYLVCVWRAGLVLDVPSLRLRKALLTLDSTNRETEILLRGKEYQVRTIGSTMPKEN